MPYYVKDDTLTQREVEYTADLQINHFGNRGVGLEATDARMYEPLRNYSKNGLGRMYSPVFTIGNNHSRKYQEQYPYISYYLQWPHNIGLGNRILSLEACETEEGPWTEVARVDATNEPLSWTETRVSLKLDVKNRGFGSGSGDTGGASKHGPLSGRGDITGYVQIGTYYPRSWQSSSFSVSGMQNLSFYYIIGNDRNGLEYTDYDRERYVLELVNKSTGQIVSTRYLDSSNRSSSWTTFNWNVSSLSGNVYLRVTQPRHSGGKYDGMGLAFLKGTSTITHYKSGDATANFYFNNVGEFSGAEVIGDGRPYLSGSEPGRGSKKKFFRFSCISAGGNGVIKDVKPNNSSGYVLSPFGRASEKWWEPKEIFVKQSDQWKEVREAYVKYNGNWEKIYPIFVNTENYVSINDLFIKSVKDYIPLSSVYIDNVATQTVSTVLPPPVIQISGASSASSPPTWAQSPVPESGYITGTQNWGWSYSLYNRGEKLPTWGFDQNDNGSKNVGFLLALEVDGQNVTDLNQVGTGTISTNNLVTLQDGIKKGDLLVAVQKYYVHGSDNSISSFSNNRPSGWTVQSLAGGGGWYSGIVVYTRVANGTESLKSQLFHDGGAGGSTEIYTAVFRDTQNSPIERVTKLGFKSINSDNNPPSYTLNWTGMNLSRTGSTSTDSAAKFVAPLKDGAVTYVWSGWNDRQLTGSTYSNPTLGPTVQTNGMIYLSRSSNHYAMTAHGYFVPYESGQYQFRLYSDDGSYFYLGNHAKFRSKRTAANAQINFGGLHPPQFSSIYTVTLTAGVPVPFWTGFWENHGQDMLYVYAKSPSDSALTLRSSNWDWKHDPNEDFTLGSKYYGG